MSMRAIDVSELSFDLKKPCKDCPFKKSTPVHEGILADLMDICNKLDDGTGIFTCHKTDPNTDSTDGQKFKGKLQHCAGFMIMAVKSKKTTDHMINAYADNKLDLAGLELSPEVSTRKEFVMKHADYCTMKLKEMGEGK